MNDVLNRQPDRRQRRNWQAEVTWPKGTLFFVDENREGRAMIRQSGFNPMFEFDERFEDIYTQLEEVEETPRIFLHRVHAEDWAMFILDRLHADGIITLDQIKQAYQRELE